MPSSLGTVQAICSGADFKRRFRNVGEKEEPHVSESRCSEVGAL